MRKWSFSKQFALLVGPVLFVTGCKSNKVINHDTVNTDAVQQEVGFENTGSVEQRKISDSASYNVELKLDFMEVIHKGPDQQEIDSVKNKLNTQKKIQVK